MTDLEQLDRVIKTGIALRNLAEKMGFSWGDFYTESDRLADQLPGNFKTEIDGWEITIEERAKIATNGEKSFQVRPVKKLKFTHTTKRRHNAKNK